MNKQPLPLEWINRIFMRLHGRFGNTFFDKYRIGTLNAQGQDIGIENAKVVWSEELSGTSPERIKAALEANYEYAPSCDDFKANCYIRKQVEDYKALPAPIDRVANKAYADNVVQFVAAHTVNKTDYHAWAKRIVANPEKFPSESLVAAKLAMNVG
jgi:hypothetical protein